MASQSEAEFVAFLNTDMRVDPHWLKGLIDNDTRAWVDILEPQGSPP